MDEETERILDEIIQHRNKAMQLFSESIKLSEEAKKYPKTDEKTAVLDKIASLNSEADAENEKADKLHNELLPVEGKKDK